MQFYFEIHLFMTFMTPQTTKDMVDLPMAKKTIAHKKI
jgi:hypothetical protein